MRNGTVSDMEENLSNEVRSITSSAASLPQACYQNLPQHIKEEIVHQVGENVTWNGFICDLRLVNHSTNEAVLHYFAFRSSPRSFHPEHYMSCVSVCRRSLCRDVGVSNEYYSRLHLQGRLAVRSDKDAKRQIYYEKLAQALAILEHDLASLSDQFVVARSYLNNPERATCGSRNPSFNNKLSIVFCDMIVEYSKMLNFRHAYAPWLQGNIHHKRRTNFWVRSFACYLGDIDLLKHHSLSEESPEVTVTRGLVELSELLGMAARRRHEVVFEYLLADASKKDTDFRFALSGACYSTSDHIVQAIFRAAPEAKLSDLCLDSLRRIRESECMPLGYSQVAQLLLDKVNPANHLNPTMQNRHSFSMILWAQASLNATDQVRYLLDQYAMLVYWPLTESLECSMSALWSACVNGNEKCVQMLLNAKYFRHHEDIKDICTQCRPIAMRSNSLLIYEKLSSFMGRPIENAPFADLAGMDGTINLMAMRLEIEPNLLEAKEKYYSHHPQPRVGQMALVCAAMLLRVANVKFLLEQGVRLDEAFLQDFDSKWSGPPAFQIEWRYRRAHESEYQQVQKLLQEYGVRRLSVEV